MIATMTGERERGPVVGGLASTLVVGGLMLILGALAGPFGFAITSLAAAYLLVPALIFFLLLSIVGKKWLPSLWPSIGLIVGGWLLALATATLIASVVAAVPLGAQTELTPGLLWATLTAPFAAVGIAVALIVHVLWRRRRGQDGAQEP